MKYINYIWLIIGIAVVGALVFLKIIKPDLLFSLTKSLQKKKLDEKYKTTIEKVKKNNIKIEELKKTVAVNDVHKEEIDKQLKNLEIEKSTYEKEVNSAKSDLDKLISVANTTAGW